MAGRVPVLESVKASIDFLTYSVPQTFGVLTMVMLVNMAGWFMGSNPAAALVRLVAALVSVMAAGALLRLAFVDEHPGDATFRVGPLGLQWGMPEWRLLGGLALLGFLTLLAFLAWLMAVFIFGAAAVVASGSQTAQAGHPSPAALQTAGALAVVVLAIGIWIAVRVCLYPAATVSLSRLQVFSTWTLTKGQFWPILAATLLLSLPAIVLSALATHVTAHSSTALLGLLWSAVNAFVELPLLNGLYAYLYRGLRPAVAVETDNSPISDGPWRVR